MQNKKTCPNIQFITTQCPWNLLNWQMDQNAILEFDLVNDSLKMTRSVVLIKYFTDKEVSIKGSEEAWFAAEAADKAARLVIR